MDQRHGFDAVAQFHRLKRDRPVRHALPLQLQRVADGGEAVLDLEVLYQDAAGSKFGRFVAALVDAGTSANTTIAMPHSISGS